MQLDYTNMYNEMKDAQELVKDGDCERQRLQRDIDALITDLAASTNLVEKLK